MRLLLDWALAGAYMALIFFLSAQGPSEGLLFLGTSGLDKVVHAAEFGLLAVLLMRAFDSSGMRRGGVWVVVFAAALTAAYGALDEWHQSVVPGRVPSLVDACADVAGAGIAAVMWLAIARKFPGVFLLGKRNADTTDKR